MNGPRASVGSPAAAAGATSLSSPFNFWNRRPQLADRLQRVGEYIRFKSSLPARLNEFAILIVARLVAISVNVDRTPIPNGGTPPLPVLR